MDGREFMIEQLDAMHRPCCDAHDEDMPPVDCREDGDPWPCPWEERRREVEHLRAKLAAWQPVIAAAKAYITESEARTGPEPTHREAVAWRSLADVVWALKAEEAE